MTTTATKTKRSKSTPFQAQAKSGQTMQSFTPASLPIPSVREQERLSDWDHSS
ncbi:hypothetical protein [Leptodesmis sp.]|uniref:hypothetical protein n=1 Tax=Leptodesmis sp. TaxID=3100501 RepID=UPI004053565C